MENILNSAADAVGAVTGSLFETSYSSITSFGSSLTEHVTTRDTTGPQNAQL